MTERVLVIGGTGMLGHRLVLEASARMETWWTARSDGAAADRLLPEHRRITNVEVRRVDGISRALATARPTTVVNCAGTVKQRAHVADAEMIATNALFPHTLAETCAAAGIRLIHLSTDCVFSGDPRGDRPHGYGLHHLPDPVDLYGRTKLVGEVAGAPHLTVRTSMVGQELSGHTGLLSWFLRAPTVDGFPHAHFSGMSTPALARALLQLIERPDIVGLHHLAGPAIDKYSLLELFRDAFRPDLAIGRDESVRIDRRLDGRAMDRALGVVPPGWLEMVDELRQLRHQYEEVTR